MVIGVASSIPKPGDAKPFDLLGIPLILLRNKKIKSKSIIMFVVIEVIKFYKKSAIKNVLRCPYHSWSYNLEGKFVSTPHLGGMNKHEAKDFNKSLSNLKKFVLMFG